MMNFVIETVSNTAPERFASDEQCWTAVVQRDPAADGVFYYSVTTTGVYCRPSCAARLARRENVRFHSTQAAAERAGFRPCKRCRPDLEPLEQRHAEAIAKACRLIEQAETTPDLQALAGAAGMSRFHFQRVFKATTGLTPKAYATSSRTQRVREELGRRETITDAIYEAGFNSNGRFYATSSKMLGMKPAEFRAGGINARMRFAIGECWLGSILVAASEKGICAIFFGDDPEALARALQDRFPQAQLTGGDAEFEAWMAEVVGFVEAPGLGHHLPLDVRGTAFQQRVWTALTAIPPGSTATYSEIAAKIGAPTSTRAVAQACAANRLAVAIPCHRVVRTDRSLSGYRWGVERKRKLLEKEATAAPNCET
jgi:AraC family transcriptional regulator, regulatory protein of adaptative response / methylated-DNA-[protein]-cysteine methyltransferase